MRALLFCLALGAAPVVAQEPERPVIQLQPGIRLVSIFSHMGRLFAVFMIEQPEGVRQLDLVDLESGQVLLSVIEGVKPNPNGSKS